MSLNQPDFNAAFRKSLQDHWRAFLIEGIVLVILGVAAITLPPIAGLATTIVLGWLFLFGGIVGLIATFNQKNAPGFWWSLLSAAIAVLAGGVLLANPAAGVATLTYVLIAFFLIDGVLIRPGDWLVGDKSGICVVPQDMVMQVLELAEEREEMDRWGFEGLRQGKTAQEMHRHFKDDDLEAMHHMD